MINEQTLLRQRNAIAEFSELALRSSCLETVLDEACRLISQALEAPRAKYLEYHPDQGAFWVRSGMGWDNGIVGELHITVEEGTPEWYTLLTKSPVISAERAKEERFVYHKFMVDHGSQSFLSVPVFSTERERHRSVSWRLTWTLRVLLAKRISTSCRATQILLARQLCA